MSPPIIGLIGIIILFSMLLIGVPMGVSFISAGFIGLVMLKGLITGLTFLGTAPLSGSSSYVLCTIPLFVLMGQFAFQSGISTDLFNSANKWLGRLPGGLALATNIACTGFAACTGTSVAGAATMGAVAFPEMMRFKYDKRLAAGCIAAGGTLGILIPPSILFIIYGVITETSIGALFIAGILPGVMLSSFFLLLIYFKCKINPELGPPGDAFTLREKLVSLKDIWGMLALLILVIGGLYAGIFSPSEAGGIGAFGSFLIMLVKRKMRKDTLFPAIMDTAQVTVFFMLVVIGVHIFNTFITVSGLPQMLVRWVTSLPLSPFVILLCILAFYIPLGCTMDSVPMVLLTMPFVFPIIEGYGFDPVWFGVLVCVLGEMAMITPPIGMNLYVTQGVTKLPLIDVVRGILPFVAVLFIGVVILVIFPGIALYLPSTIR